MNVVFYVLVAVSLLFAAIGRAPETTVDVVDGRVAVALAAGSPVKAGSEAVVDGETVIVETIDGGRAVVAVAHSGTVTVSFPEEEPIRAVNKNALDAAKDAVGLAISLAGAMTLFLGLVKVIEAAGTLDAIARAIRPVMVRLFPDVPSDHPAMGAMIMNLAANVLGLGNAATPFGIKAMQELQTLNPKSDTATNAMVRFLAINTSGVAVLPTGVMAMRASLGSRDPAAIFTTTLIATSCSTLCAIVAARMLERPDGVPLLPRPREVLRDFVPVTLALAAIVTLIMIVYRVGDTASAWIVPALIGGMLTLGVVKKVKVYETFIEGARDGFNSAIRIVPYLVAILVAVAMLRASGGMRLLVGLLSPIGDLIGLPAECIPLAILRPLSGSGGYALTAELTRTHGPDSYIGHIAGTLNGSTETTFYVLAVYFGAVGVMRSRHAVAVGLIADVAGMLGSVLAVRLLLGSA